MQLLIRCNCRDGREGQGSVSASNHEVRSEASLNCGQTYSDLGSASLVAPQSVDVAGGSKNVGLFSCVQRYQNLIQMVHISLLVSNGVPNKEVCQTVTSDYTLTVGRHDKEKRQHDRYNDK